VLKVGSRLGEESAPIVRDAVSQGDVEAQFLQKTLQYVVIPAVEGLSTAELVIQIALDQRKKIKMDSRFRGTDDNF
jgi:2-keto-3-deoxy-L-rhamnonate aldolase RhmA